MLSARISALALALSMNAPAQVPSLDPAGLAQALKAGKWTVIEFGGPTCVPCRNMQPILAEIQQRFGNGAAVRNFYITEHPKVASAYKVMAMPTQVVFDPSGREVTRHVGFWKKEAFLAALAQAGLK